jgi:hypothetical protein
MRPSLLLRLGCVIGQPFRAAPVNSVAVLYFDNLSRDTADACRADGLTEEIIGGPSAFFASQSRPS